MIENWKKAYKMASVWVFAVAGSLAGLEAFLPAFEGKIPPAVYAALMILGIVARLVRQKSLEAPENVVEELRRIKAIAKKGGLISLAVLAVGCASPKLAPSEIAQKLASELTPEQRECVLKESATAALKAGACGKNNEGVCNNDRIYAEALERKYACLVK